LKRTPSAYRLRRGVRLDFPSPDCRRFRKVTKRVTTSSQRLSLKYWSERRDLNSGPLAPHTYYAAMQHGRLVPRAAHRGALPRSSAAIAQHPSAFDVPVPTPPKCDARRQEYWQIAAARAPNASEPREPPAPTPFSTDIKKTLHSRSLRQTCRGGFVTHSVTQDGLELQPAEAGAKYVVSKISHGTGLPNK